MMHQTSINHRDIPQFSYMRIIACIAIVGLHSLFASNVYFADTITQTQLTVSTAVEHMLMWAVPVFLMVTGALQLNPQKMLSASKLIKYIKRVALALVVFTLIFQILDYSQGDQQTIITGWLQNLFMGHSWAHMWYLYLLIGIYLMLPFYKIITEHASDRLLMYLILLMIVFVSLLPICDAKGIDCGFYIPTTVIYPIYLFLGYLLHKNRLSIELGIGLFVASSALIISLSLFASSETSQLFSEYASITVIAQSIGAFTIMQYLEKPVGRLMSSLDDCSFGIYLIHMIGVRAVMKWAGFDPYSNYPVLSFIGMVIAFFIGAYIITYFIRKIPKLNLL